MVSNSRLISCSSNTTAAFMNMIQKECFSGVLKEIEIEVGAGQRQWQENSTFKCSKNVTEAVTHMLLEEAWHLDKERRIRSKGKKVTMSLGDTCTDLVCGKEREGCTVKANYAYSIYFIYLGSLPKIK